VIDSHCHLDFPYLKNNFNEIIQNIIQNNITSVLTINTDPKKFKDHLELISNYKSIFISYGLHPTNIDQNTIFSLNDIILNCKYDKVIGIGETGLDFFHSIDHKLKQYEIFEAHIQASIDTKLPLIIHQRNSEIEIIDVIKNFKNKNLSIVFHCFTGSKKLLDFCIENNYYISLSGIITFKNAKNLREIIKNISIDNILLETDSPFLSPVPMRGKTNEPAFVKYTAKYLSNFFNIPFDQLIKKTDNNFYKLFSKAKRYNYFE